MINYTKESWQDVHNVLEALFYDWTIDLEGNLIVHWENFDICNEKTGKKVDHVDHLWLKFIFKNNGRDYDFRWWRSDKNPLSQNYIHPHVADGANNFCSGSYSKGVSLCQDLHYLDTFVKRYNRGAAFGHAEISKFKPAIEVDEPKLKSHLYPTFFFDVSTGSVELDQCTLVDINQKDVFKDKALPEIFPSRYVWKDRLIDRKWNGVSTKVTKIDLTKYYNHEHLKSIVATYNRTRVAETNTQVS